ncbi:MAG: hypothetical protein JNK53_03025 [Phycisphaerae bacterium]|nr:hypothetical protein [Phycisphaerae bacterium]
MMTALAMTLTIQAADAATTAPPAATGSSTWLAAAIILLAVGVAIAVLEMFVPSGGILAVAAATALIGSVACFFAYDTMAGVAALALYAAGAPIAIVVGLKIWTHTPFARGMVLGGVPGDDEQSAQPVEAGPQLVGKSGIAITPMRPVGFVRLGDERIEAQAETGMIEPGTRVTIIACAGPRIMVRPSTE